MKAKAFAKPLVATGISLALAFSTAGVASAQETETAPLEPQTTVVDNVITEAEIDAFSQEVADKFVILMRDGIFYDGSSFRSNDDVLSAMGFSNEADLIKELVDSLNNGANNRYANVYTERSLSSFGKCVVTGVLGFSPFQIDYNLLGKYIKEKAWNKVADLLQKYAKKEIKKKAGSVLLKQIIKSTPAGFAAWLGVYAVGCAGKEAWDWWIG
ncbi:hypothetical protein [Arcanobacterium phocae]|uniref:hypothetical protein n=1 Tax=Arcanobacterium phocae TaxID=131112 RepID=UPI001C118D72|nr:hypothetical protein [Arcanobacterium phocae]